jgi:hypothetical protein
MFTRNLALVALLAAGCSKNLGTGEGVLVFTSHLSGGAAVGPVTFQISGNGINPITGTIDGTPDGGASTVIGGIPAGADYTIDAQAASTDGSTTCAANVRFAIVAGAETDLELTLQCKSTAGAGTVRIAGTFDNCPAVTAIGSDNKAVAVGNTINLFGSYSDLDGDPVCFSWRQSPIVGEFTQPADKATGFICRSVGLTTLTLNVGDRLSSSNCEPDAGFDPNDAGYITCTGRATLTIFCGYSPADGGPD